MLFDGFTHPSTILALLIEAGLLGVALAAATGRLVRPARRLARGLAAIGLALGLGTLGGMLLELATAPLPFVRPEAPLGTYAQMTQLGLLVGALHVGLIAVGAGLAFRRARLGGLLLGAAGAWGVLESCRTLLQDPTLPPGSFTFGLVGVGLPALVVGALLLATWRGSNAGPRGSRGAGRPRPLATPA